MFPRLDVEGRSDRSCYRLSCRKLLGGKPVKVSIGIVEQCFG